MASRGWENFSHSDAVRHNLKHRLPAQPYEVAAAKKSKYRNVKTRVEGITFDSKREADYWLLLRNREALGEISELQRQRSFALMCPNLSGSHSVSFEVARYLADFCYRDGSGKLHVVDAKGHRTREYALKKKWLFLQEGIEIEEV